MNNLLIRASQAHKLMTKPKTLKDQEAGILAQTTQTYLKELWLENTFGYKEPVVSDEIMKGWLCEQDSMTLTQDILGGELRLKNTKLFKNDFIKGTPDVILKDVVEDVKSSWSIKTFFNSELESNYWWQGQCYMELTGIHKYRLIYCLNDTPEHLVTNERQRYYYKFQCDEDNPMLKLIYSQIEHNHSYSKIPKEKRIKIFNFDYDPEAIKKLYSQIEKARNFYNSLEL